jgi:acyl-CoA reductase-like NAD-dependent aldehyde dehydrogenase
MTMTTDRISSTFRTQAFIDGTFVDAVSGRSYQTENPATGQPLAEIAEGDLADVDRAVAAARAAADGGAWSGMHPGDRKRMLIRFADLIDDHTEELALTESLDAGKPLSDTRSLDIPETAGCIRWHAEAIDKLYDEVAPVGQGSVAMIVREPIGVVGAIVPWNYPAQMAA